METTSGAVAGAAIGLELWLNCRHIAALERPAPITLDAGVDWHWLLLSLDAFLLTASKFELWPPAAAYAEYSLILGLIPIVAIAEGRWWPFMVVLPVTLGPIAGKTLPNWFITSISWRPWLGWLIYVALPLALVALDGPHAQRDDLHPLRAGPLDNGLDAGASREFRGSDEAVSV